MSSKRRGCARGASLGANSTIVCGVEIGAYALIGAGAVVTRDVPAYALITGVPGRQTGWACRCGITLSGKSGLCGVRRELRGGSGAAATAELRCAIPASLLC